MEIGLVSDTSVFDLTKFFGRYQTEGVLFTEENAVSFKLQQLLEDSLTKLRQNVRVHRQNIIITRIKLYVHPKKNLKVRIHFSSHNKNYKTTEK